MKREVDFKIIARKLEKIMSPQLRNKDYYRRRMHRLDIDIEKLEKELKDKMELKRKAEKTMKNAPI